MQAEEIAAKGLWLILELSLLPLLASLFVGLLISLFQALTQIQEQTLTFVPKAIITTLVIIFLFPSMIRALREFTNLIFEIVLQISSGAI